MLAWVGQATCLPVAACTSLRLGSLELVCWLSWVPSAATGHPCVLSSYGHRQHSGGAAPGRLACVPWEAPGAQGTCRGVRSGFCCCECCPPRSLRNNRNPENVFSKFCVPGKLLCVIRMDVILGLFKIFASKIRTI